MSVSVGSRTFENETENKNDVIRPPRSAFSWFSSTRAISFATIVGLIVLWWIAASLKLVSPIFLPSPAQVLAKFFTVAQNGFVDATLAQHLGASLARVFAALVVSIVIAVPVGLAIGLSRIGRGILDPILEFLRPIPPLAYLPLIVIWFGIGELSKVLVIFLAMLAPITLSTASGVRSVSQDRLNAARAFDASRWQLARYVVIPHTLPSMFTGVRIALGAGWTTLVAAELVAATKGLGFMIQSAAQFLVTDVVIMGIIVIAVIAFALELVLRKAEAILIPWAGRD
ncbi:taurine ABC transporter permease TauC [Brucella gallinifaecis]|uniref:Taurine ABC transporter permease TauC n=1 Tax=Brucella gallinifaecis TaxID=215590 RepID=A0A502BN75_9HYPH|nr:taurine ABC transporter permease TauC [Brucella gallinifaecis]TPF74718.1 taurine ABC transporter permease TauC [Brucella gallinifaecis]